MRERHSSSAINRWWWSPWRAELPSLSVVAISTGGRMKGLMAMHGLQSILTLVGLCCFLLVTIEGREEEQASDLFCKVSLFEVQHSVNVGTRDSYWSLRDRFFACHPVSEGRVSDLMHRIDLPQALAETHEPLLAKGQDLYIAISDATLTSNSVQMTSRSKIKVVESPFQEEDRRRLGLQSPSSFGDHTALVLRIIALDSEPTASADELYQRIFTEEMSLSSQLSKCSFGKFRLYPTEYGVLDIPVELHANGSDYHSLVNAGYEATLDQVGNDVTEIRRLADFIIIVIPPGTGDWGAFASIPGKQSVFNDEWGIYLGATAHELGHNLGLRHAYHDGVEYAGVTGYMGAAFKTLEGPQRCYNGQNHWHLGWYADKALLVPIKEPRMYTLAAFVDYDKTDDNVLIFVEGANVYLQFNRAKDFNEQTGEYADMLTIVIETQDGTDELTGLNTTHSLYSVEAVNTILVIEVCEILISEDEEDVDVVYVSIGANASLCTNSTFDPSSRGSLPTASAQGANEKSWWKKNLNIVLFALGGFAAAACLLTALSIMRHRKAKRIKSQRKASSSRPKGRRSQVRQTAAGAVPPPPPKPHTHAVTMFIPAQVDSRESSWSYDDNAFWSFFPGQTR